MEKVNFSDKFLKFSDHWSPKVIAEMNDYQFKLVKIEGEFTWHNHGHTDEVFIVIEGSMMIEFENKMVELNAGEMYVVPKGVMHKPHAPRTWSSSAPSSHPETSFFSSAHPAAESPPNRVEVSVFPKTALR